MSREGSDYEREVAGILHVQVDSRQSTQPTRPDGPNEPLLQDKVRTEFGRPEGIARRSGGNGPPFIIINERWRLHCHLWPPTKRHSTPRKKARSQRQGSRRDFDSARTVLLRVDSAPCMEPLGDLSGAFMPAVSCPPVPARPRMPRVNPELTPARREPYHQSPSASTQSHRGEESLLADFQSSDQLATLRRCCCLSVLTGPDCMTFHLPKSKPTGQSAVTEPVRLPSLVARRSESTGASPVLDRGNSAGGDTASKLKLEISSSVVTSHFRVKFPVLLQPLHSWHVRGVRDRRIYRPDWRLKPTLRRGRTSQVGRDDRGSVE